MYLLGIFIEPDRSGFGQLHSWREKNDVMAQSYIRLFKYKQFSFAFFHLKTYNERLKYVNYLRNMMQRYLAGFLFALAGALLANWLHLPLPWMIGPLLVTAISKLRGARTQSHVAFRSMGQWVIGTSLGLYFTEEVLHIVLDNTVAIVLGMLFALFLGSAGALALRRWGEVDFKTAWFASAIGGASEMANLAERNNARIDRVASAHSLRVLLVVVTIPFVYKFLGLHGLTVNTTAAIPFSYSGFFQMVVITCAFSFAFGKLRIPNPWVLGPLFIMTVLTSNHIELSVIPPEVQHAGQMFIGWSLGDKFGPDFFRRAPKYLGVVALVCVGSLCLALVFCALLTLISDIPLATLYLANSPGGIAEMTITAKVLQLGPPVVTAFHVSRMVFVLLVTGPLYRLLSKKYQLT